MSFIGGPTVILAGFTNVCLYRLKLSHEQLEQDESLGPCSAKRMRVEPTAQQERILALEEVTKV